MKPLEMFELRQHKLPQKPPEAEVVFCEVVPDLHQLERRIQQLQKHYVVYERK